MVQDISMFCDYGDVLTVKELQSALKIGRNEAYRLVKEHHIHSIQIGRTYRIPKTSLLEYVGQTCYNDT